jgi:hypothetical protein
MIHARAAALDALEDLLAAVRTRPELTERKRGTFYRKSSAFLHFHEDPAGLFADVKLTKDFERFPVNTPEERQALAARVAATLDALLPVFRAPR